uniref:Membrane protein n=1 Tax=uncultured SAR11 cluster alpha proteobacterium H17925_23J24 TaxID=715036 RepID=E7C9V0_9PROT|nr:membrane protein [uncultured SAR11 cluster alpha proteobacterium H17925_23J24]
MYKRFFIKLTNKSSYLIKNLPRWKNRRANFMVFSFLFMIIASLVFSYNNSLKKKRLDEIDSFLSNNQTVLLKNYLLNQLKSPYLEYDYIVQNNDTIESILKKFSVKQSEINFIVEKIKKKKLSNIIPKQKMKFILKRTKEKKDMEVLKINYPLSDTTFVNIDKRQDGIEIKKNITQLFKRDVVVEGNIKNNLYSSAVKAGMEPNIIVEYARIFGFEVDFQRDIRKGDRFEVMYERFLDDRNKKVKTGKILYAYLDVNNQKIELYRFGKKNNYDFYDKKGRSIRKALMKTPINGARLSSGFGNRKHPILGFTKHHNGTDFAAPTGTPIMASGNGTVIKAGWCGNGGNCVRIRHNSSYTTGYGHLSKFATKTGRRVRQGQIIGYVGNTGMSTGPHLHYTVSYNGKFINSQKLKLPSGKILKGEERKLFEVERIKLDVKLAELKN